MNDRRSVGMPAVGGGRDDSCMASSAHHNPSLIYMALTARAADYAVEELKRRNL